MLPIRDSLYLYSDKIGIKSKTVTKDKGLYNVKG